MRASNVGLVIGVFLFLNNMREPCFAIISEGGQSLPFGFYPLEAPVSGDVLIGGFSDDGRTVTGRYSSGRTRNMFVWEPTQSFTTVDSPPGYRIQYVGGISGDGRFIGGSMEPIEAFSDAEAFRWSASGGFESLGRLSNDQGDDTSVGDLNYDGSVVVGWGNTPNGLRAFRWTASTGMVNLGTLGSSNPIYNPYSTADVVSDDGTVIGGTTTKMGSSDYFAARWTAGRGWAVPTPQPGSRSAGFIGMNHDGTIMVGVDQVGGSFYPIIWDDEQGLRALPQLEGYRSNDALSVTADGAVVGGWGLFDLSTRSEAEGIVWTKYDNGYDVHLADDFFGNQGIDLSGWEIAAVNWVSQEGKMFGGSARNASGQRRPFVIVVPESSTFWLSVCATLVTIVAKKRQARMQLI